MRLFLFWIALLTPYFAAENYNDIDVDFQRQKYKITPEQVHLEERLKLLDEKYISYLLAFVKMHLAREF